MKKVKSLILFTFAALILFAAPVFAEKNIYKAGVISDYQFNANDISAYADRVVNDLFSYLDNAGVDFTQYKTSDGLEALKRGQADFISMLPKNEALSEYVDFTDKPVGIGFLSLFVKNETLLYFEDFKKLNGVKIALVRDSYFENMLLSYASQNNFSYTAVYCDTIDEVINTVKNGGADAFLSPATTQPEGMRLIAKCGSFEYFCAVDKGDTKMLNILNKLLSDISQHTPFYLSSGYESVFRIPYKNMVALTEDDYAAVIDQKQLRVMVPDNRYPMVYYDIEKGEYAGIYIDILKQIAENAGLTLKYVPDDQKDMTMDSITLGKADALISVSGSTQGLIEATDPYTTMSFIPVSKKDTDISADSNLNVGILADDSWIIDGLKAKHPKWIVSTFNSINSLLWSVETGKISAALICTPDMQTKTSLMAHPALHIPQGLSVDIPVSLGISKVTCRQQVINMLNGIIQYVSVPNAEFESKAYTLSHIYIPNLLDMLYANKIWIALILVFLALVLIVIIKQEGYVKRLVRLDPLTHIYNKRHFLLTAEAIIKKNPDREYLLVSVDAKNFKLVNDRFGTIIGDQTLKTMATNIKKTFYKTGAVFGRIEGDEFLIIAEDNEKNRTLIDELVSMDIHIHDSTNYQVQIKIGVYPIPKHDSDVSFSIYIDKANIAKEDAVGNHNYLRYFTDEMAQQLETKNDIEIDMVPALKRGDFVVYYQPKYDLKTDKIIGAEALVRWQHKTKGVISPGLFVPIFEKNGFIVEVDFHVYDSVLKMLKRRIDLKLPIATVSLNVSRCHLSDPTFCDRLEALVDKYNVPKRYIEMEITESIFSEGDNSAFALVYELKNRGFSVSMDDFGSGYSSLNLLRKMPIDTLKIDKVFIDDIEQSIRSQYIVEEVIALAKRINVKTICEGVETEKQRDILKEAGCDMVQGYFYSRPLSADDFEHLLNNEK